VTYYVLFFIEVGSRRVSLGGITRHPDSSWMEQVAWNATMQDTGYPHGCRYLLHDRDKKFCSDFGKHLPPGGAECTPIPARSPNLNAHAERWVRSIKEECIAKLILFGEPRYGVSCPSIWNIITKKETTKAKATFYFSRPRLRMSRVREVRLAAASGSAAYSSTTGPPREWLVQTASISARSSMSFFTIRGHLLVSIPYKNAV
jgi:hypothetical protein